MADFSKRQLDELGEAVVRKFIKEMNSNVRYSTHGSGQQTDNFDELKNILKNNGLMSQFVESMRKLSISSKELKTIYDALERTTRNRSESERKINMVLIERLKNEGNVVDNLKKLKEVSDNASKSLATYKKDLDSLKDVQTKLKELEKRKLELILQDKYDKKVKSELNNIRKEIADTKNEIKKQKESIKGSVDSIDELNNIVQILNKEEMAFLKNRKAIEKDQEKYIKIMNRVKGATDNLNKDIKTAASALSGHAQSINDSFETFKRGLASAGKKLFEAFPIGYKDMMAQAKYGNMQSDYLHNWQRGLSESQRSEIIGNNHLGFRLMGSGNEQKGWQASKVVQEAAHNYGVTGAAAIQLGSEYQQSMINAGLGGQAKDVADQMKIMKNFSTDIGITDEQLKGYYDSLVSSGQMLQYNTQLQGKSEEERRKAINKEIYNRLKLNQQLGISLDMQKQINQENINKQFGGLASTIMGGIKYQQLAEVYSELTGVKLSKNQNNVLKQYGQTGTNFMSPEEDTLYKKTMEQISKGIMATYSKSKNNNSLYGFEAQITRLKSMGFDTNELLNYGKAEQKKESIGKTKVTKTESYASAQKDILDKVNNGFTVFNKRLADASEILKGISLHPLGPAAGQTGRAVGGFIGGIAQQYLGNLMAKGTGKLLGRILKRGGANEVEGAVGEGAETAAATAEGMAIGDVLVPVLAGAAALTIGIAIGNKLSDYLDKNKTFNKFTDYIANLSGDKKAAGGRAVMDNTSVSNFINNGRHQYLLNGKWVDKNKLSRVDMAKAMVEMDKEGLSLQQQHHIDLGYSSDRLKRDEHRATIIAGQKTALHKAIKDTTSEVQKTNTPNDKGKTVIGELESMIEILNSQLNLMKDAKQKDDQGKADGKAMSARYGDHVSNTRKGMRG